MRKTIFLTGLLSGNLLFASHALAQAATTEWLTYNNGLEGQRFSHLSEINTANASQLGEVCRVQIDGPASFHAGLIVSGSLIYTNTSRKTVALDARTCDVRWMYDYQPEDPRCGGSNRGLALQNGRLYRGTCDGRLIALDAKMVVDDNALFRHAELAEMRDFDEEAPPEREARKYGLSYVKLDGDIGCMVNGAGLAMATMDVIKLFGGEPANFLDIGGGAGADKVAAALGIILSDSNVQAVLFNIFGGITRCDEVARGILMALKEVSTDVPMVVRLTGTNEAEGQRILAEADMLTAGSLSEAAQTAVSLANERHSV